MKKDRLFCGFTMLGRKKTIRNRSVCYGQNGQGYNFFMDTFRLTSFVTTKKLTVIYKTNSVCLDSIVDDYWWMSQIHLNNPKVFYDDLPESFKWEF